MTAIVLVFYRSMRRWCSGPAIFGVNSTRQKLMLWGNRNGFFYVLDRTDGEFLLVSIVI